MFHWHPCIYARYGAAIKERYKLPLQKCFDICTCKYLPQSLTPGLKPELSNIFEITCQCKGVCDLRQTLAFARFKRVQKDAQDEYTCIIFGFSFTTAIWEITKGDNTVVNIIDYKFEQSQHIRLEMCIMKPKCDCMPGERGASSARVKTLQTEEEISSIMCLIWRKSQGLTSDLCISSLHSVTFSHSSHHYWKTWLFVFSYTLHTPEVVMVHTLTAWLLCTVQYFKYVQVFSVLFPLWSPLCISTVGCNTICLLCISHIPSLVV